MNNRNTQAAIWRRWSIQLAMVRRHAATLHDSRYPWQCTWRTPRTTATIRMHPTAPANGINTMPTSCPSMLNCNRHATLPAASGLVDAPSVHDMTDWNSGVLPTLNVRNADTACTNPTSIFSGGRQVTTLPLLPARKPTKVRKANAADTMPASAAPPCAVVQHGRHLELNLVYPAAHTPHRLPV